MRQPPKVGEFFHYPITAGTAVLAIAVTVASMGGVDISALYDSALIRHGEVWRLITSAFPHVNLFHLVFNIYWLWIFGTLVEDVYGHMRTAALILLFAFGSGALEYAFGDGGIGLSGVGYGLFGLLWILSKRDSRFVEAIDTSTIQLFVAWFFICIVTTYIGVMRVGNIAHGGGAILGILTACAISQPERRWLFTTTTAALLFFGLWGSTLGRPAVNVSSYAGLDEARRGYDALTENRNQEAVRWFEEALKYRPNDALFLYDAGIAYERIGESEKALAAYRKGVVQGDASCEIGLGGMYEAGSGVPKSEKDALLWYRKAADQGSAWAQNQAAWIMLTSSDPANRDYAAALAYATKAVGSAKDKRYPNLLDTLAEAYYANNRFDDAVKTEQSALASLTDATPTNNRPDFEKRLDKYQRALKGMQHP